MFRFSFFLFLVGVVLLAIYSPQTLRRIKPGPNVVSDLKNIVEILDSSISTSSLTTDLASVSSTGAETNELLESAGQEENIVTGLASVEIVSPVLSQLSVSHPKLIKSPQDNSISVVGVYSGMMDKLKEFFSRCSGNVTSFCIGIVLIALLSKFLGIYRLAVLGGNLGWNISRFWLFIVSITAVALWFLTKRNFWEDAGTGMFFIPIQLLIASAFARKIMDFNFPIWNRLLGSLILPGVSGILISVFRSIQG